MILGKFRGTRRRRAITAVLGAIILLSLVQVALVGYFLVVVNGDLLGNQANQNRQNSIQVAANEKLVVTPGLTSGTVGISVADKGSVSSTIMAVYVKGLNGTFLSHSVASPGSNYLVGLSDLNVSLPLTINPGQSTSQLTACGQHGCNIGMNSVAFSYAGKPVVIGVITLAGNIFSAQYPIPTTATTLTQSYTSATTNVVTSTTSLTTTSTYTVFSTTTVPCSNCVTATAVGPGNTTFILYLKACPSGGCASSNFVYNGGSITLTANVTNISSQTGTGVQLFVAPASGLTTGTASVSGTCAPPSQTIGGGKSVLFTCSFTGYSGSTGGTVTFAGYAAGTVASSYSTSASATSNVVQIGNIAGGGAFSIEPFSFYFESSTPAAAGVLSAGTPTDAGFVSTGNAYVSWLIGVKNTYNQSMTILDESFMITERLGPDPTWWIVDAACYPGQTGCGTSPTLTSYSCYGGESSATSGYNCITVPVGATQQVILATCAPASSTTAGSTTWGWSNTRGGGGCGDPTWSPVEGDAAIAVIFYTLGNTPSGTVYSTVLPIQAIILTYPSSITVVCTPNPVVIGSPTTCTGTVTSTGTPTGTLQFSASPGTGTFSPSNGVCTLASGKCSVTFTPNAGGPYTITAYYGGDSKHGPTSGSTTVSTAVTIPILIATPTGGSAFTYTVSGCSVSPTSGTSGASATSFTATSSCVLTVTMPTAGTSTRYVFASSASSTTVTTCSSSTCSTFQPADYYQLAYTLSYSVTDGGTPSPPTFASTQAGSSYAPTLTTSATKYWLDYGVSWSVTNPLTGSGTTERWQTSQTVSGTVSATSPTTAGGSLVFAYYNQYFQTLSYNVNDGGSGYTAPATIGGLQFGSSYTPTLTTTATGYWFDATGTITFTNPLTGSSSTDRWDENSVSVPLTSSNTKVVQYYNQFALVYSYAVSGGGSPTAPTLACTQFGSAYSPSITTTATTYWCDNTYTWTVSPNPLTGSSTTERWDSSQTLTGTVGATLTTVFTFYNQYSFTLSYSVSGGGSPTAPTLTSTRFGASYTPTLTTTPTAYWLDSGQSWSVTNPLTGSGSSERWATQTASGTVSSSSPTTAGGSLVFTYYNQYAFIFSYLVSGSGSPTAPTLTSTQFGGAYAPTLTTSATTYWLDSSASWSLTNPLGGSGSSERWDTSQTVSGTVGGTVTTVFTYYNQYLYTLSYSVADGGSGYSAPTLTSMQFGSSYTPTLTTTATAYWLDNSATCSVTNPLGGSGSSERWDTATVCPTVSASRTVVFAYYNQYLHTLSYSIVDGGTPTAPTATGTQFGSAYAPSLTTTATGYWFDATGTITFSTLTGTNEQWAPSPSSVAATSSNTQVVSMYNQYKQTLSYSVVDGGTPTAPTATGTSLGVAYAPSLTTTATGYWFDASGTITFTNPLPGSGSTERWETQTSSVSATLSNTQVVTYYNQYGFTLSYSVSGGGSGYSASTLTSTQFGATYTPALTTTATAYWLDSGQAWSITNPLGGSGSTERWYSSQTVSGTVSASSPTTAGGSLVFTYNNQYAVSFARSPTGGGTTSPTGSNVWENSGSLPISATPGTGYKFIDWTATGSITFASSTSASTTATISGSGTITAMFSSGTYAFQCKSALSTYTGATSFTVSVSGCSSGDIIIVVISENSATGSLASVVGSSTGTYTPRGSESGNGLTIFEYYKTTSSATSETITITVSASHSYRAQAFGISGVCTSAGVCPSPLFDSGATYPLSATAATGTPTVSGITTSNPSDIIIAVEADTRGSAQTVGTIGGSAATAIGLYNSGTLSDAAEYRTVTSTLTSQSATFGTSVSSGGWVMLVDVIDPPATSSSQTPGQVIVLPMLMTGSSTGVISSNPTPSWSVLLELLCGVGVAGVALLGRTDGFSPDEPVRDGGIPANLASVMEFESGRFKRHNRGPTV